MRKTLVRLHLWLGLSVGLLWAVQGLTGAALVFHRDLDRLTGPAVTQGAMASLDTLVKIAERTTGQHVKMVTIADGRGDLLNVHFTDAAGPKQLLMDAASGAAVGLRDFEPSSPLDGSGWRWIYRLHETLLMGHSGETLIGLSGLLLLSSLLMGIWLGWPRRRPFRAVFAVGHWRTMKTKLYGWHRLVGLTAAMVLLATIPAGIWMIFASDLRPIVAKAVPHQLAFQTPAVERVDTRISPQTALDRARAHFPMASFVRLTMPTPAAPFYGIRLRQPNEVRAWSGVTTVSIDPATGRTLHIYDPLAAPLSNKLADAAFSVHSGELAGLGSRILVLLAGLSLPVLYITGVVGWLRASRRRRRVSAASAYSRQRKVTVPGS